MSNSIQKCNFPQLEQGDPFLQIHTPVHFCTPSTLNISIEECCFILSSLPDCTSFSPFFFHQCVFRIPLTFTAPLHLTWQDRGVFLTLCLFPQCATTAAQETCTRTGRWLVSSQRTQYECLQLSWDVRSVSRNDSSCSHRVARKSR